MTDRFRLHAQWAARRESASDCAGRMQHMMHDLARCHELLSRWNEQAESFAEAMKRHITPTREGLTPLFEPFEPITGQRPEDSGFSFSCWNGRRDSARGASIFIHCGRIDTWGGLFNQVWLDLPDQSPKVETLYQPDVLERIMRAMLHAWEPDSIALLSNAYNRQYTFPESQQAPWPPQPQGPDIGWFTYLSANRLNKLSGTPPCDEVITLRERGSFFIISREHLFSIDSPDDIARLHELKAYLEANHALMPLPQEKPPRQKAAAQKKKSKPKAKPAPAAKPHQRNVARVSSNKRR